MNIWSYVMSFPDDCDVLPDALDSLAHISDRLFVVDGGMTDGTLSHHPRYRIPLSEWFPTQEQFRGWTLTSNHERSGIWRKISLTLFDHPFRDPAHQRVYILSEMMQRGYQPDWIIWIDSDEVLSHEFIRDVHARLESFPKEVVGVYVKRLCLVQDEQHCVDSSQSNWLAHPTIHRPGVVKFSGNWHEHMLIDREHLERWDSWAIIHSRALFRKRLWEQRGHSDIANGDTLLWSGVHMENVPIGVTWKLHWPNSESVVPFGVDVREFYK